MNILKVLTERRRIGNFGEDEAARLLRRKGYRILERGLVTEDGEIDVIARDREHIVYVEVKTRRLGADSPSEPRAAAAVDREKQRKILRAAALYHATHGGGLKARFDIVEVYYEETDGKRKASEINHLEGAFNKNTAYRRR